MDFLPFGVSLYPAVSGKCVNKALPPREGHGLQFVHREGSREGYLEFVFSFRNLRETWEISAVWQSRRGWRLLPPPACGTGVPGSKSHNPWHFGSSEGFEFLMQSQGSLLVVISVLASSHISTFGRSAWRCWDDHSREGRREVCAFPSCLQGIVAGFGVTVSLTGLVKVPTSSSLS